MKKILLISAGVLAAGSVAATPAIAGLTGNQSFSHEIPIRVPSHAQHVQFTDDHGTDVTTPASTKLSASRGDDRGRTRHPEPGDDRRTTHETEPGDDRGTTQTEPGDDRGTTQTEPGDDRGTTQTEPGDDGGRTRGDGGSGHDGGHGGHGGDDGSDG